MAALRPRASRNDPPRSGRVVIAAANVDRGLTAILKWTPVEVIASYKALVNAIPARHPLFLLWVTLATIPVTSLWIAFATRPKAGRVAWRQVILAPVAFTFWAAAMETDLMNGVSSHWEPWMGSLAIAGGTLLLPILDGVLFAIGVPQN
jgi:hypothetical protein